MARYISFAVLLAIIVVIGALFYKVMIGFFVPVFLAAVLVVVFRPLHRWVCSKVGAREHIAAGITTTLIVLIVLIPTALVLSMAAVQGASLYRNLDSTSIKRGLAKLRTNSLFNLDFPMAKEIQEIQKKVSDIQIQVAKQQPFQDLVNDKGLLRSDMAEIRDALNKMIPRLIESSRMDFSARLIRARGKSTPKVEQLPAFDMEIAEYFQASGSALQELLANRGDKSDADLRLEKDAMKSRMEELSLKELSQDERALAIAARAHMMDRGIAWHSEIQFMTERLDACQPNDDTTMAELQRGVADLVSQWMRS